MVGIGDISTKRAIPAILEEERSHLYGVVTRDPAKAARYQTRVWTSLDEAVKDAAIDAVYISSPVFLHSPQTILALRAGKHVLCEKPMAMNYAEACSMRAAADDMDRILGIAYYRRMYPKLRRAKELLDAGAIGKPVVAEATSHSWFNDEDGTRSWLLHRSKLMAPYEDGFDARTSDRAGLRPWGWWKYEQGTNPPDAETDALRGLGVLTDEEEASLAARHDRFTGCFRQRQFGVQILG